MTSDDDGLTRRSFMKVAALAGGGLCVGFLADGCAHVSGNQALGGGFNPNAWLRITPDDRITFTLDKAEMGQGVMTSQLQLLCEELEVEPARVVVELAGADDKRFGVQVTGGSTSTTSQWDVLRKAGATTRELLKRAAARRWGVSAADVVARRGALSHPAHGTLRYGDVADDAAREHVTSVALKEPAAWHLIGTSVPRIDAPQKVDGSARFGIDVRLPGMLHAVVIRPPSAGARLAKMNDARARAAGAAHVVVIPQGVAVVARNTWTAQRCAGVVDVEWAFDAPAAAAARALSSEALRARHLELLRAEQRALKRTGDARAALAGAARTVSAIYEVPFLAHAAMEPMNAVAWVEPDRCRVWAPLQAPTVARGVAALACGLPREQVEINQTLLGGGFGRRGLADFVGEAVAVSAAVKGPVQVVWSRADDLRFGQFRPASLSLVEGGVDAAGMPVAWRHRMTGQSLISSYSNMFSAVAPELVPRHVADFLGAGVGQLFIDGHLIDPTAVEGASDQPYAIEHQHVEVAVHETPVPVAAWRAVGHTISAFTVEGFIDELAHLGGRDPVALRRTLLAGDPRRRAVLEACAQKLGWFDGPPPPGRARGIAQHACFNSFCAIGIELSCDMKGGGGLRLHRAVAAIDCGRVVNPDIVKAQLEGGVIFGLSAALYQRIDFDAGQARQSNFHDYPLLRMPEAPAIETVIVPSTERPTGVGELAVPPVAPALANAIFAATGVRLRRLPFIEDLRAMEQGRQPAQLTL